MANFVVSVTCETTKGNDFVSSDRIEGFGPASDHLAGMVAAIGEDNIIEICIEAV